MITSLLPLKAPDGAVILSYKVIAERKEVDFAESKNVVDFYSFTGKTSDGKLWLWIALKSLEGFQSVIIKWGLAQEEDDTLALSRSEIYNGIVLSNAVPAA